MCNAIAWLVGASPPALHMRHTCTTLLRVGRRTRRAALVVNRALSVAVRRLGAPPAAISRPRRRGCARTAVFECVTVGRRRRAHRQYRKRGDGKHLLGLRAAVRGHVVCALEATLWRIVVASSGRPIIVEGGVLIFRQTLACNCQATNYECPTYTHALESRQQDPDAYV